MLVNRKIRVIRIKYSQSQAQGANYSQRLHLKSNHTKTQ